MLHLLFIRQAGSEEALALEEELYVMLLPIFHLVGDISETESGEMSEMQSASELVSKARGSKREIVSKARAK